MAAGLFLNRQQFNFTRFFAGSIFLFRAEQSARTAFDPFLVNTNRRKKTFSRQGFAAWQ
jgi:hypothetical protein